MILISCLEKAWRDGVIVHVRDLIKHLRLGIHARPDQVDHFWLGRVLSGKSAELMEEGGQVFMGQGNDVVPTVAACGGPIDCGR